MNYNYFLLIIIALCITASFLRISKLQEETAKMEAAAVIDEYINKTKNKSDADLSENEEEFVSISQESSDATARTNADGSEINTMSDRYGNKTETRCFDYHPRINCVMLSTSAEGQKKVFVYGQNGDVKDLPEEMLSQVMTASADEIANAAGINLTPRKISTPTYAQTIKPEKISPNQTVPINQPQIQNQSMESDRNEDIKTAQTTGNNEKNAPAANEENSPKTVSETPNISRQPEEK